MSPSPERAVQKTFPARILLFLFSAVLLAALVNIVYQAIQTLNQLDAVERKRDQWQRPGEIIQALNPGEGKVVADIGSGAGYFAIKLSSAVGTKGSVLAVDIRRLPLAFLRLRAVLRNRHNISVIHSDPDNPSLPAGAVDAVLIANTYHEFAHPKLIMDTVFQSLRTGGRLVIVDRGSESAPESSPKSPNAESSQSEMERHEMPLALVAGEIGQSGFEILNRQDRFIDAPEGSGLWWLLVARKP